LRLINLIFNPLLMIRSKNGAAVQFPLLLHKVAFAAFLLFAIVVTLAPTPVEKNSPTDSLPQDSGKSGLQEALLRLHTTARMLHTTAHPDDEDGGMMTLESRGRGVTTVLMTLNRGEGGQNKVGSNLFDVLGVLRTLELTASDRYYGVEQRFTRVADFGFSKDPNETFEKWGGHDSGLADIVRVIRTFRPDVLVSRFQGTDRDGHGNHQASGILSREAFRAAGDPNRFSEQIKEGLLPWQPKKYYMDNVCGFRADTCPDKDYTLKLPTGEKNARLGMTYLQFAMEGLKHQLSQGAGSWSVDDRPHFAFYRLVDSILPSTTDSIGHEKDFFDGIDTTLPGLANRLGAEGSKLPFLRLALVQIQADIERATGAAEKDPAQAIDPLVSGEETTASLIRKLEQDQAPGLLKNELLLQLRTKQDQFQDAIRLASGASLQVFADVPTGDNANDAFMAVPGQTFDVVVDFSATDDVVKASNINLDLPKGWTSRRVSNEPNAAAFVARFSIKVAENAEYSRPYWHRDDPETQGLNTVDDPRYATLPFPPAPVKARVTLKRGGSFSAVCMVKYKDGSGGERKRALAVAPPFSIWLDPVTGVIPASQTGATKLRVDIRSNIATDGPAKLHLELPAGWHAEPSTASVSFARSGEDQHFDFQVHPAQLHEGHEAIKAVVDYKGKSYNLGYSVVTREDLDTFYYYQPATQRASIIDVKVPKDLKIGYIMGAGDDIPTALEQLGLDVIVLPADKLADQDLSRFGTVVLGIRAYDTQKELIANNKKLLDFVSAGGTLVVQYNASTGDFNSGQFTPYPTTLSRSRVSVEEAPVEILAKDDSVFHYPNQITQHDFDGWVQERGLYFMDHWDSRFIPLLSSHDPGEEAQKGGLLRAQYGKGTYIYAGYAFFRQLPAGVPGATRLYVNLLSAGHEKK